MQNQLISAKYPNQLLCRFFEMAGCIKLISKNVKNRSERKKTIRRFHFVSSRKSDSIKHS